MKFNEILQFRALFVILLISGIILVWTELHGLSISSKFVDCNQNPHHHSKLAIPPVPSVIGIGCQKCSSSSIGLSIVSLPEVGSQFLQEDQFWTKKEYCASKLDSFEASLAYIANNTAGHQAKHAALKKDKIILQNICRVAAYRTLFEIRDDDVRNNGDKVYYYFTKTPDYILYPHIARTLIQKLVVPSGTKLFAVFRDPVTRFVSGLYHTMGNKATEEVEGLIQSVKENNDLKRFIEGGANASLVSSAMTWRDVVYKFVDDLQTQIWLRGCYAPQMMNYILELRNSGVLKKDFGKHIMFVQFEPFHANYSEHMTVVRCWMAYGFEERSIGVSLNGWMKVCSSREDMQFGSKEDDEHGHSYHVGKATRQSLDAKLMSELFRLYAGCVEDVQRVHQEFPMVFFGKWEFGMWKKQYN